MKKRCPKCEEKVKSSYSFCPSCGFNLNNKNDYGLLGRNDLSQEPPQDLFSGGLLNKMLGSAMKMIEKELQKDLNQNKKQNMPKMKLMINGKEVNPSQKTNNKNKKLPINFSNSNLVKWREVSKVEPESKMSRIADNVVYEIQVPEVNSIEDVSIINLESSLEVRALGKKVGYKKTIPFNSLKKYSLSKGILTLEIISN